MEEMAVKDFKLSRKMYALDSNSLVHLRAHSINKIANASNLIMITTQNGHSIKMTPMHRMLVMDNGSRLAYAKDILKGAKIATVGRIRLSSCKNPSLSEFIKDNKKNPAVKVGPKMSYFIGAMLGDGYSGAMSKGDRIIYKGNPCLVGRDNEIFDNISYISEILLINSKHSLNMGGTPQLVLGKEKWFREFLVRCGIELGERKHISQKLLNMDDANISSLLRGLFDTDGYVQKKSGPGFCSISSTLIRQVQMLLLRFGIISSIRKRDASVMKIYSREFKTKGIYELSIRNKRSIVSFFNYVGFAVKRKQFELEKIVARMLLVRPHDPHHSPPTH